MSISRAILTTAAAPIYTSTGESAVVVGYFCNRSNTTVTMNMYITDTNESNTALVTYANAIVYDTVEITAHDTLIIDMEKIILGDGNSIQANASQDGAIVSTISWTAV
jgi:hypothetical protein